MESVSNFVDGLVDVGTTVGSVLFSLLNLNFVLLNSVIGYLWSIISMLVKVLVLLCDGLLLATDEFKEFVKELFGGVKTMVLFIQTALQSILSLISYVTSSGYLSFLKVGQLSQILVTTITDSVCYIFTGIASFLALTVRSVVLILESLPWAISNIYNGTFEISSFLLKSFVIECNNKTASVINSIKRSFLYVTHQIRSIPRDAYIGLIIIFAVYIVVRYMRHLVLKYMRRLSRFILKALQRTIRAYRRTSVAFLRCVRNVNAFCLLLLRYLPNLSAGGDDQEEDIADEDSDDASYYEPDSEEPGPATVSKLKRELESQKGAQSCIVCLENPKNMIFLPCRHMCACEECCQTLVYRRAPCPLCRNYIRNTIRVYT